MTIAVAIRTSSAVVFAADSKVTTAGLAGFEDDGRPRFLRQAYDNATKVAHDRSRKAMAMIAGDVNVGSVNSVDFVQRYEFNFSGTNADQDAEVRRFAEAMVQEKRRYWAQHTNFKPEDWPGPTMFLSAIAQEDHVPRTWILELSGEAYEMFEVLKEPYILLEGAYAEVYGLLYGMKLEIAHALGKALGATSEQVSEALKTLKVLKPINEINVATMPLQDALDLAAFLARVQIEMDRFTPGEPACGGPIDLMVLTSVPVPQVLPYYGKVLHHPASR